MKAKKKYTDLIKELIRNEAVTDEKLKMLVNKFGTNKKMTSYYLRTAGVIERLGKDVHRVLIRDEDIEPYVDQIAALATPYRQQKSEPADNQKKKEVSDMSLPGKWEPTTTTPTRPTVVSPYNVNHDVFEDPDMDAAEEDIDMHSRVLDMVNSFMDKVQINTNKQNEYILELEAKVETLVGEIRHYANNAATRLLMDDAVNALKTRIENMVIFVEDKIVGEDKRIASIENRMNMCGEEIQGLDDKIDSQIDLLEDKLKEQTLIGNKNGMLKALHQLIGELI